MREVGRLLMATILVSACMPVHAASTQSDFEAYRRQQQQGAQQLQAEFRVYKEKQDAEFADFLKSRWREFDTYQGKVRIKEPKPRQVPVVAPAAPLPPTVKPSVPAVPRSVPPV